MKQHVNPCGSCPFTNKCKPGELGGSSVEVYVGQTYGPFWVPCHQFIDYNNPDWRTQYDTPQCVGHAIMQDNLGISDMMPGGILKSCGYDGDRVFVNMEYFWAYHKQITLKKAQEQIDAIGLEELLRREFTRAGVNIIPREALKTLD